MDSGKRKIFLSWCLYDWANSGFATVILATVLPVYFAALVPSEGAHLPFLGNHSFSATSLWGYSVALSMFLIAVLAPALGSVADRDGNHKKQLAGFWLTGCGATALLFFAAYDRYLFAALLFIVANFAFAGANIFYNAYLPHLTSGTDMDRLSSRGYAYGYLGGGLLLALVFLLIVTSQDRALATRWSFVITAAWWFAWAIPAMIYLPATSPGAMRRSRYSFKTYLAQFRMIAKYRDLLIFLIAFLCYNDGIQTLISVSAIYAREELHLSQGTIIGCFLMIQFVAMPGALLCGRLSQRVGAKRTVMLCLLIFLGVSFFAYRMSSALEFWVLGAIIALILGGSQALSRALYASLIPPARAAEFFGFFTISSKFAAIFGPLVFALITDLTGSSRQGILTLGSFFVIGGLVLATVNVRRGQAQALTN